MSRPSLANPDYAESVRARLLSRSETDENGCRVWLGYLNQKGYGIIGVLGGNMFVHRAAYHLFVNDAPLPPDYSIDHLCRNRACLNPAHLEAVPHGVNVRRGKPGQYLRERTHCNHGHEFTPENSYVDPDGGRRCLTCRREGWRRSNAKRRQKVAA